jgi:hypothetical protein
MNAILVMIWLVLAVSIIRENARLRQGKPMVA